MRDPRFGKEYVDVHLWLRAQYGKADHCENQCGSASTRFEWAKLPGKPYARDRANFKMLCKSCHARMDQTKEVALKMSLAQTKRADYLEYCIRGHRRTEENTRWRKRSHIISPVCKDCQSILWQLWKPKRRNNLNGRLAVTEGVE